MIGFLQYFLLQIIDWLNSTFRLSISRIEQCATGRWHIYSACKMHYLGAIYCQIMDSIRPASIPMRKVNWNTHYDYEFLPNFKLLQKAFLLEAVAKQIDVERLVKGRYQENLEFCQFMYQYYMSNISERVDEYDAVARRRLSGSGFYPDWAPTPLVRRVQTSSRGGTPSPIVDVSNLPISSRLIVAEKERDFYFSKLEKIEKLAEVGQEVASTDLFHILHSMEGL